MDFVFTALVVSFVIFLYFILRDPRQKGLPPGPHPWPIVGNLLQISSDTPHIQFAKLAQTYGDFFTLRLGYQTVVVASSPAAATEILKSHDRLFSSRYVFQSFRVKNHIDFSLVWSDCNDNWKMLRKVCRTELFSPTMITSQAHLRETKASEMVKFLRSKEGEVVKIAEVVFGTLINIFGNLIFSRDVFDLADPSSGNGEMKERITRLMELGNSTNPADYFPILAKFDLLGQRRQVAEGIQQIFDVWGDILRERRERKDGARNNDFVDVMIKAGLSDQHINALLMEILGGGTETSASAIEWAIAEITKNPRVTAKLRSELVSVVGEKTVKESDIPSLPYLQACVKESLRLHPPTPFLLPHRAIETCQVMNHTIPKNCRLMVNAWAIGRDPKTWDDALIFSPERFMNSSVDYKGNDFEVIPFGAGRRICPGLPLAAQFVHLIVATLVQNFEWDLPNGMDPSELNMDGKFGLTLHMEPPLLIVPKVRV